MIVALYARVSTPGQDPDNQINRLLDIAKARDYGEYKTYIDVASGAKARRPALDRMLDDAKHRQIDKIICTKLDRMARSTINLLEVMTQLDNYGVPVSIG